MSGGSNNYLCFAEMPDIITRTDDMEMMEDTLNELGYTDIAAEVHELRIACLDAIAKISFRFDKLAGVFHDVEWYHSADIGKETLLARLSDYRMKNQPIEPPELKLNKKESE